jgi:serine/threonine-protein kinase RsbW
LATEEIIQELSVPSMADQIQVVEEQAEHLARMARFSDEERDNIAIAITEMVANAIFHGNKADSCKKVHVRFTLNEHDFIISIRDEGPGFDPAQVADPLQPENLLKDRGRGIFIVRTLMDQVEYVKSSPGMEVVLTKHVKHKVL